MHFLVKVMLFSAETPSFSSRGRHAFCFQARFEMRPFTKFSELRPFASGGLLANEGPAVEISQQTMPLKRECLSNHGTGVRVEGLSTDRAMLTLSRCRRWEETAGRARVPMTSSRTHHGRLSYGMNACP